MLLKATGGGLSRVSLCGAPHDGRLALGEVDAPEALLDFYATAERRQIMLRLRECVVGGVLGTLLDDGERRWWIELDGSSFPILPPPSEWGR